MRSDLVKASLVLGVGFIVGSAVIVLGMRWAIGSALSAHLAELERLNTTMAASAEEVESAVTQGSVRVSGSVETSSTRVSETVASSAMALKSSVDRGFEEPLLIRAPASLPVTGVMGIEGAADGRALNVAARIGRQEEGERQGGSN